MGAKKSAGILLYRRKSETEYFLVHPGGPFWAKKDEGAWSIPKGEYEGEDPRQAALREFEEETGTALKAELHDLGTTKLKSGKVIVAYAAEGELDETNLKSNFITLEWPPRTGKIIQVPEVDKGAWFTFEEAMRRINGAQRVFLERLYNTLK